MDVQVPADRADTGQNPLVPRYLKRAFQNLVILIPDAVAVGVAIERDALDFTVGISSSLGPKTISVSSNVRRSTFSSRTSLIRIHWAGAVASATFSKRIAV